MQKFKEKKIRRVESLKVSLLMTKYQFLITALAPALTSCMGVYDGGFECPPGEGVGCKSISEVNLLVDQSLEESHWLLERKKEPTSCEHCSPTSKDQPLITKDQIWYSPWALGAI